jgi:thiamine-phosphate pyrophosphorylase
LTTRPLHGLYAITDETLMPERDFLSMAEQALLGGARLIQYRDKTGSNEKRLAQAGALKSLCQQLNALLIINDDIELADAVQAHGVHLGRDDSAIHAARLLLGPDAVIGVSCYDQLELAQAAEKVGVDYIAFGAFFPSVTKPEARAASLELLTAAKQQLYTPVCTIGGITAKNAATLVEHGADMTAVISDLFASDDIHHTASQISRLFG